MVCLRHWYYRSSLAAASAVGFSRFQQRRRHFKLTSFARFLSHDSGYKPSFILDFLSNTLWLWHIGPADCPSTKVESHETGSQQWPTPAQCNKPCSL